MIYYLMSTSTDCEPINTRKIEVCCTVCNVYVWQKFTKLVLINFLPFVNEIAIEIDSLLKHLAHTYAIENLSIRGVPFCNV